MHLGVKVVLAFKERLPWMERETSPDKSEHYPGCKGGQGSVRRWWGGGGEEPLKGAGGEAVERGYGDQIKGGAMKRRGDEEKRKKSTKGGEKEEGSGGYEKGGGCELWKRTVLSFAGDCVLHACKRERERERDGKGRGGREGGREEGRGP